MESLKEKSGRGTIRTWSVNTLLAYDPVVSVHLLLEWYSTSKSNYGIQLIFSIPGKNMSSPLMIDDAANIF